MSDIRKKLIEVDLPLDEINNESRREKSLRHGHPSTLHTWWARRPLASCRAVIFASLIDDPVSCPDEFPTEAAQQAERERLHDIIRGIIVWESTDESRSESLRIQNEARYEIARSIARSYGESPPKPDDTHGVLRYLHDRAPTIHDPFAGGGSIPIEAQRLGLRSAATDLNPVAVLINKALIEIPPKFAGKPPINPNRTIISGDVSWRGASGLADDIRYYGRYMRGEALKRIGHLYPEAKLPDDTSATVIAWLWARTIPCPNPACGVIMPLVKSFQISKRPNNQHWTRPIVDSHNKTISFVVQNHDTDVPKQGTVTRYGVTCIACGTAYPKSYVRKESMAGHMGSQMTAIVAQGNRKRIFLSPTDEHIRIALSAKPDKNSILQQKIPATTRNVAGTSYGITHWHQLFTKRQLTALITFGDLLAGTRDQIIQDGADTKYADAISTYLALSIGKTTQGCSSYAWWMPTGEKIAGVFGRQVIPMIWDYAEVNPFSDSSQNWMGHITWISKVLDRLPADVNHGMSRQMDASVAIRSGDDSVIVTDPPYYDNISYAEISDFFYIWLRSMLHDIYPELFAGIMVPKQEEMIAAPRFKTDVQNPKDRFERLMSDTLQQIHEHGNADYPSSIFYAYKQQEEERGGRSSTGWDTMLSALISAGFQIVGTWPIRTERAVRLNSMARNALASSIILVCRERAYDAKMATWRQFVNELRSELYQALRHMRDGGIAPVDMAQATIGPGMAVFTRYTKVLDIDGNPVSVREALTIINQTLDEMLAEREGDFDADTRWAVSWFEQYGFDDGEFGDAETLSKAKNTSVLGLVKSGILESGTGKVRLLRPSELPKDWDPNNDDRFTVWEATHHLMRTLGHTGEDAAAGLMHMMESRADAARDLAYRLYDICQRKNRSQEAWEYNALVQSWPEIVKLAKSYHDISDGLKSYY